MKIAFAAVSALLSASLSPAATPVEIELGAHRQLFLDDHLIDRADNLRRVVHPARKFAGNPVLWDTGAGGDVTYGSVIPEDGKFRMWYARGRMVSYAESTDGNRFSKPALDLVRIDGQKTNVLFSSDRRNIGKQSELKYEGLEMVDFSQLSGVTRTRETDPAKRYLMGFISIQPQYSGPRETPFHPKERRGFGVAASPDGLRWTLVNSWATETFIDGPTYWLFDPQRGRYVQYGRTKLIAPEVAKAWGLNGLPTVPVSPEWHEYLRRTVWGRAVSRAESNDLITWDILDVGKSPVVLTADAQDPPGAEMYAMQVFAYEGLYIGLIKVWRRLMEAAGPFEIQLAVSRDGYKFERVGDRSALISEGGIGEWDRFNTSTFMNDPIVLGDEMRIYFSAQAARHSPYRGKDLGEPGAGVGYATVKRDRFVSLATSYDGGTLQTKLLRFSGRNLKLNAKADFGSIVVEVLDRAGQVRARSKPWRADSLDGAVEWESGSLPANEAVVLRLHLKNAHLFALWFS